MKKSMIISTIAMIVVVVVALSTATYAWFTSSAITKATVSMTVTSTGDFAIAKGTPTGDTDVKTYTFTQASTEVQLSDDMKDNIYAPTTSDISTMSASVNASNQLVATNVGFVNAQLVADKAIASANSATKQATAIRVSNISGTQKQLTLSIVINTKKTQTADITDGTKYAIAGTSFAIAYAKGTVGSPINTSSFKTLTNGYNVTTETSYTAGAEVNAGTEIEATSDPAISKITLVKALALTDIKQGAATTEALTNIEKSCGIGALEYYYTYDISLGAVEATDYVYFVFYTWFDGITVGDTAKGCSFDLTYAFYAAS